MTTAKRRTLYLVQQVLWEPLWGDLEADDFDWEDFEAGDAKQFSCPDQKEGRPVRFFIDRSAAEKYQVQQEPKLQRERNPFHYGENLGDLTTMPAGVFHDWVLDSGLTPPWHKSRVASAWASWWAEQKMTDDQRAKVWQALDRVRFFTIVPLEAAQT